MEFTKEQVKLLENFYIMRVLKTKKIYQNEKN